MRLVPPKPKTPPLRILRRILLAAMLLLVVGVAGLFVLGRASRPEDEGEARRKAAAPPVEAAGGGIESAVLSEGFDYEQQVDGKPVFRLQGDRFTTDREGRVSLDGVRLRLFREGEPYDVSSQRATYLQETQEASLEGSVRLAGNDGWAIESERLDLPAGGRVVITGGGRARFSKGKGLSGGADRLRYELDGERLLLEGEVRMSGRESPGSPRVALAAGEVSWARGTAKVVASGAVELTWAESVLHADRIEARLLSDESGFEAASALGDVRGTVHGEHGRVVRLEARRAEVAFEPVTGDPMALALSAGKGDEPARLHLRAPGEGQRRLTAPEIRLGLVGGAPDEAEAWGGVLLEEAVPGAPKRIVRSEKIRARFAADGSLAGATLDESVELRDERVSATGQHMTLEGDGERAVLTGAPAVGKSERGELSAPRLIYDRAAGRLRAEEGVRARFQPGEAGLPAPSDATSREPIQVEAREGLFTLEPRTFDFSGTVQAVQGETLLFADRLTGDEPSGKSSASGKVRTIWKDPAREGSAEPSTTVIQAEALDYTRGGRELRYRGGVQIRQGSREIRAEECAVELDEQQRARRVRAQGKVRIEDRVSGRTVEGDAADYDLESRTAVVTGEPVVLREKSGTVLQGRRALFDLATGTARLLSEKP